MKYARGFTLIELLVTIAIIAILASLGFAGYSNFIKSAQKSKEVHAGRALMAGFHAYAADNAGRLIKAMDTNPGKVLDDKGKVVMSHAAKRWPWRLAPYIDYNVGILMVNNQHAAPADDGMYSYLVTVFTTFGMNGTYVGGKYGTPLTPENAQENFCVTNIAQVIKPSKLVVFALGIMQGAEFRGCFDVSGPGTRGVVGQVDYRYNGKTVAAYFDGHVELNSRDELNDMTRWSNLASQK